MRPYEVMIILDPTLEDDAVRAEVDRSTELIRSKGGNPGRVERWGKRRLAYEIRRQREGNYVLLEAEAEPSVMADLDRSLQLADRVLRHKVVRRPDKPAGRPARPLTPTSPADGPPPVDPAPPAAPASTAAPAEPTSIAADPAASAETT